MQLEVATFFSYFQRICHYKRAVCQQKVRVLVNICLIGWSLPPISVHHDDKPSYYLHAQIVIFP